MKNSADGYDPNCIIERDFLSSGFDASDFGDDFAEAPLPDVELEPKLDLNNSSSARNKPTWRYNPSKWNAPDYEKGYVLEVAAGGAHVRSSVEIYNKDEFARTGKRIPVKSSRKVDRNGRQGRNIQEFSTKSKKMMEMQLNLVNRKKLAFKPLVLTLTFEGLEKIPNEIKFALQRFKKVLKEEFPKACGIWKLEFTKNQKPHFHVLIFGVEFIPHQWLGKAWHRSLYNYEEKQLKNKKHLIAGSKVQGIRGVDGIFKYVSKYINKEETSIPSWWSRSRFWGYVDMKAFKALQEVDRYELTKEEHLLVRDAISFTKNKRALGAAKKHKKYVVETEFTMEFCHLTELEKLPKTYETHHGVISEAAVDEVIDQGGSPIRYKMLRTVYDGDKNFIGFLKTQYSEDGWSSTIQGSTELLDENNLSVTGEWWKKGTSDYDGLTLEEKAEVDRSYEAKRRSGPTTSPETCFEFIVPSVVGYTVVDQSGNPLDEMEDEVMNKDCFVFLVTNSDRTDKTIQISYFTIENLMELLGVDFNDWMVEREEVAA